MSMYRQLWLAIVVSTALAMVGCLLVSLLSARSYLEAQLSIKNTDNATALALSLSQTDADAVMVELAETRTARILWADSFDHRLDDAFLVLDAIGNRIVASSTMPVPSRSVAATEVARSRAGSSKSLGEVVGGESEARTSPPSESATSAAKSPARAAASLGEADRSRGRCRTASRAPGWACR